MEEICNFARLKLVNIYMKAFSQKKMTIHVLEFIIPKLS